MDQECNINFVEIQKDTTDPATRVKLLERIIECANTDQSGYCRNWAVSNLYRIASRFPDYATMIFTFYVAVAAVAGPTRPEALARIASLMKQVPVATYSTELCNIAATFTPGVAPHPDEAASTKAIMDQAVVAAPVECFTALLALLPNSLQMSSDAYSHALAAQKDGSEPEAVANARALDRAATANVCRIVDFIGAAVRARVAQIAAAAAAPAPAAAEGEAAAPAAEPFDITKNEEYLALKRKAMQYISPVLMNAPNLPNRVVDVCAELMGLWQDMPYCEWLVAQAFACLADLTTEESLTMSEGKKKRRVDWETAATAAAVVCRLLGNASAANVAAAAEPVVRFLNAVMARLLLIPGASFHDCLLKDTGVEFMTAATVMGALEVTLPALTPALADFTDATTTTYTTLCTAFCRALQCRPVLTPELYSTYASAALLCLCATVPASAWETTDTEACLTTKWTVASAAASILATAFSRCQALDWHGRFVREFNGQLDSMEATRAVEAANTVRARAFGAAAAAAAALGKLEHQQKLLCDKLEATLSLMKRELELDVNVDVLYAAAGVSRTAHTTISTSTAAELEAARADLEAVRVVASASAGAARVFAELAKAKPDLRSLAPKPQARPAQRVRKGAAPAANKK